MKTFAVVAMFVAMATCAQADHVRDTGNQLISLLQQRQTSLGANFNFQCNIGMKLYTVASQHNNWAEDRIWQMHCTPHNFGTEENHHESSFVNEFDELMAYKCPSNGLIRGLYSEYSSDKKDRRWKVFCVGGQGLCATNCQYSTPNNWDSDLSFDLPTSNGNWGIRGIVSVHDSSKEDRRYVFEFCDYRTCCSPATIIG